MKSIRNITILLSMITILTACNLPKPKKNIPDIGLVSTIAAMTLESMSYTDTPTLTPVPPTATVTPTITPTYSVPMLSFNGNTNCRKGPGTDYDVVTVINNGQKAEIIGIAQQANYWLVKNPKGKGDCWVSGDFAVASGSVHILPTVTAPPTPTPKPPAPPTWQNWTFACEFASGGSTITVNLVWKDWANNEEGYHVYRNNEIVANLAANTSAYTDVAFLATGQAASYAVEAYRGGDRASSSTINVSCQ